MRMVCFCTQGQAIRIECGNYLVLNKIYPISIPHGSKYPFIHTILDIVRQNGPSHHTIPRCPPPWTEHRTKKLPILEPEPSEAPVQKNNRTIDLDNYISWCKSLCVNTILCPLSPRTVWYKRYSLLKKLNAVGFHLGFWDNRSRKAWTISSLKVSSDG